MKRHASSCDGSDGFVESLPKRCPTASLSSASTAEVPPEGQPQSREESQFLGPNIVIKASINGTSRGDMINRIHWGLDLIDVNGNFDNFHFSLGYVAKSYSPKAKSMEPARECISAVIKEYNALNTTYDVNVVVKDLMRWDECVWMKVELDPAANNAQLKGLINRVQCTMLTQLQERDIANFHNILLTSVNIIVT